MDFAEAVKMYKAAEAAKVRHMTAFTYRFVPAMHYVSHLVQSGALGKPYHFRAQRFQDWGTRNLGWRQIKKLAATGAGKHQPGACQAGSAAQALSSLLRSARSQWGTAERPAGAA